MRLEGHLVKGRKWWLAEIPILDAMTQGRTKAEAYEMVADLLETMVYRPGFTAAVRPTSPSTFEVAVSDVAAVTAVMLRRARARSGLTLSEVAGRLGSSSHNAYARYEQGRTVPTVEKLVELLRAVDCDLVLGRSAL